MKTREQHQQDTIEMLTALLDESTRLYYEFVNEAEEYNAESVQKCMAEYHRALGLVRNPPTHVDLATSTKWQQCPRGSWRRWNGRHFERDESRLGTVLTCLKTQEVISFE